MTIPEKIFARFRAQPEILAQAFGLHVETPDRSFSSILAEVGKDTNIAEELRLLEEITIRDCQIATGRELIQKTEKHWQGEFAAQRDEIKRLTGELATARAVIQEMGEKREGSEGVGPR